MNNIYPCMVFLKKRLNMTKVIGWLWGNGSLGVYCSNEVNNREAFVPPEFWPSSAIFKIEGK
jgi:hypothetical protein